MRWTLLMLALFAPLVQAGDMTYQWVPPTKYTDGTPLTTLTGYRIYYGTQANALGKIVSVPNPAATSAKVDNVPPGTYYGVVTALSSLGSESDPSPIVTKVVSDGPVCPASPAPESRLQSCVAPTVGNWTQTHGWTATAAPTCWTADAWSPAEAPAGVCAVPPPLLTAGPYAYEVTGTATAPTMSAIGLVPKGRTCGPAVRTIGTIKFCQIPVDMPGLHMPGWPGDKTLAQGVWARAQ